MPPEVTQLLKSIDVDHPHAADELLPLVYEELRKLASARMARENGNHLLQPTALVHEAWIRLAGSDRQQWRGQTHFFAAAAEAMRRILIDQARRMSTLKRGEKMQLEPLVESRIELRTPPNEILAIHEALAELAAEEPVSAEVVKLKFFVGLTLPEIAEILDVSLSTVERHWSYAKAWLRTAVRGGPSPE